MLQSFPLFASTALTLLVALTLVPAQELVIRDSMDMGNSMDMPNKTNLTAKYFLREGAQKVELTYGPFDAAPSTVNSGMVDYMLMNVSKPCSDCLITWMQAGLTYPNGTYANANNGLWLHHTVLSNLNRTDAVCGSSQKGESFFASGNERTVVSICGDGTDHVGYYLGSEEQLGMVVELMNENTNTVPVIVTITYEYLLGIPDGFSTVTPLWLDIGNCSSSEVPVTPGEDIFTRTMTPWKTPFGGRISFMGGHLHDGGTHLEITKNKKTICDGVAEYGQSIGYNESSSFMPGMDMGSDMTHISSISDCKNPGTTKAGDEWSLKAHYNLTEHAPMKDSDGSNAPIMGIALVYLIHNETATNDTSNPAAAKSTSTNAAATATMMPGLIVAGGLAVLLI